MIGHAMLVAEIIFWISVCLLGYIYFGYPVLILLLARLRENQSPSQEPYEPTVSLIIAAYNEEKVIAKKIENSLGLDYPKEKLEFIVFSDASTDRTDEIVKSYGDQGVKLLRIEGRKGKVFCKNVAAQRAEGEILVFSDANSFYEPGAIRELVRHFIDPEVGCVAGELRYRRGGVEGESLYWRYEQLIKHLEGKLGNLTTINGAIYAIPKRYYEPLPPDVPDDFGATLSIKAKALKVIHEPKAVAWEETAEDIWSEMNRRVRMVTRASYCLFHKAEFRRLLNPFKHGFFSLQLWSHKVLRWFTGAFLALAFLTNLALLGKGTFYILLFVCQVVFYILAILGLLQEELLKKKAPKFSHVAWYFVLSCYAMLRGLFNGLRGKTIVTWTPSR